MASKTASMSPVYGSSSACHRTRRQKSVPRALQLLQSAALRRVSVQEFVRAHGQVVQPTMADWATLHLHGKDRRGSVRIGAARVRHLVKRAT